MTIVGTCQSLLTDEQCPYSMAKPLHAVAPVPNTLIVPTLIEQGTVFVIADRIIGNKRWAAGGVLCFTEGVRWSAGSVSS